MGLGTIIGIVVCVYQLALSEQYLCSCKIVCVEPELRAPHILPSLAAIRTSGLQLHSLFHLPVYAPVGICVGCESDRTEYYRQTTSHCKETRWCNMRRVPYSGRHKNGQTTSTGQGNRMGKGLELHNTEGETSKVWRRKTRSQEGRETRGQHTLSPPGV